LEEGHACFLGWVGGKPAHVRWIFVKSVFLPYLGRSIALGPGEAYSDESYTRPEFRRRGLARQAIRLLARRLPDLGFRRLIALVVPWNAATARALEENGIRRVGECGYGWKGWTRLFFTSGSVRETEGGAIRVLEERRPDCREVNSPRERSLRN
jgi:GNAT superfamily N-acetyltransferase